MHLAKKCRYWHTCSAPRCPLLPDSLSGPFYPVEDEVCRLKWGKVCALLDMRPLSWQAQKLFYACGKAIPELWYEEIPQGGGEPIWYSGPTSGFPHRDGRRR
jgi:hypothetical protein